MSTLCVADMVHAVADVVCGRYRRFPGYVYRIKYTSIYAYSVRQIKYISYLSINRPSELRPQNGSRVTRVTGFLTANF